MTYMDPDAEQAQTNPSVSFAEPAPEADLEATRSAQKSLRHNWISISGSLALGFAMIMLSLLFVLMNAQNIRAGLFLLLPMALGGILVLFGFVSLGKMLSGKQA